MNLRSSIRSPTIPRLFSAPLSTVAAVVDFEVQKFTRVCAKTEVELKAGDEFYSFLMREGASTVRKDVAATAWEGPPEECLGWWKSEVPDPKSKKLHWAPHDVMLHYFADTEGQPEQADVRYILALLMIRRRIFRLEETETDDDGRDVMVLYCSRNESEYNVPEVSMTPERATEIQALLSELLVDAGGNK